MDISSGVKQSRGPQTFLADRLTAARTHSHYKLKALHHITPQLMIFAIFFFNLKGGNAVVIHILKENLVDRSTAN